MSFTGSPFTDDTMRKATFHDKSDIIEILSLAFQNVPGIKWITGAGKNQAAKLHHLLDFAVEMTFHQGEIFLSDDGKAVMLLFRWHKRKSTLYTLWLQICLIWRVIGLSRLPEMLRREHFIQQQRPARRPYLYCWFIGAHPCRESLESIHDLKSGLFKMSLDENLPVYIETTVEKLVPAYTRYGFEVFHVWKNQERDVTVWFMKREPVVVRPKTAEIELFAHQY
jgi:hypothetical protein